MDKLTARPGILKQANLSRIRKAVKNKGTATRAEIADETKISSTTVRSLLTEMIQHGEIESIGYDASSGGRKAERYRIAPERYYGAAFCVTDSQIHGLIVNVCGEIIEHVQLEDVEGDLEQTLISFLDRVAAEKELKSIGIGVPGVVEGGGFWKKRRTDNQWCKVDIGETLKKRYRIPVVMENDLNATAIGFGCCYQRKYPYENFENQNMAYLHFEKGCVSAGFIAGGRIIRGCNNFAGEIGLIPMAGDKLLDEYLAGPLEELQYTNCVVKIISWICGILNPQYIALGGPDLRGDRIAAISEGVFALLPKQMTAEILYSSNAWQDYYYGMAFLTAENMFEDIEFIKE